VTVEAHRDEHLDLCAAHALGSLDAADRARLEAHLAAGCATCVAALSEFSSAVTLLAAAAPPVAPPPELRERVLRAASAAVPGAGAAAKSPAPGPDVAGRRDVDAARGRGSTGWLWGWGAAAACLAFALWSWNTTSRLRGVLADQHARIAQLESVRADLEDRLLAERRWVGVVTAAGARIALLAPTPDGDSAWRGRAILDPEGGRAVLAFANLRAPEGRDYELWAIRDGKPRSLGLVQADATGAALLQVVVESPESVGAFAVSLEPKGGAPTPDSPTGPVVLVGALGG
jgi:anti-sigma-K factor RskA